MALFLRAPTITTGALPSRLGKRSSPSQRVVGHGGDALDGLGRKLGVTGERKDALGGCFGMRQRARRVAQERIALHAMDWRWVVNAAADLFGLEAGHYVAPPLSLDDVQMEAVLGAGREGRANEPRR